MVTVLHTARLDAVVTALLASGAQRVADLGCGGGELLLRLRQESQFTHLLGIDIDTQALALVRQRLGLDWLHSDPRLQVCLGSFEDSDWADGRIDAAVLLETIEHIPPGRLVRVERSLFGRLRPAHVIITTPNQEYNVLHGMVAGQRRHPGHHFEWTRAQFKAWCGAVAKRHGYTVATRDVGVTTPGFGSSTQMACFMRL